MLKKYGLHKIKDMERATLRHEQSIWVAYVDAGRRYNETYYNLVLARKELQHAEEELNCGCNEMVRFKIADKRYRAALEEMEYQEAERERIMAELGIACTERKRWNEVFRQKREVKVDEIKACG